MKKNIHPDYHTITVMMTDGETFQTRSCWGKEGDTLKLDVDPKTHSAWSEDGQETVRKTGQAEKFANKYKFLAGTFGGAQPAQKSAESADEPTKTSGGASSNAS
jgi:large subunit ribosomal protein L31